MKRTVLPAPVLVVALTLTLTLTLAGCSGEDEPEGTKAKQSATPSASSSPTDTAALRRPKLPKRARLPHETRKGKRQGWRSVPYQRPFEPCLPDRLTLDADAERTASRTATDSGPAMAQVEQVELYTTAKAAEAALDQLRDAVDRCDRKQAQPGFERKWAVAETSELLADADESFLVFGWFVTVGGDPGPPGGPVVTVMRVGNAVYSHAADGATSFAEESSRLDAALVSEERAAAYLPKLQRLAD